MRGRAGSGNVLLNILLPVNGIKCVGSRPRPGARPISEKQAVGG
jgi:hypothetical protein